MFLDICKAQHQPAILLDAAKRRLLENVGVAAALSAAMNLALGSLIWAQPHLSRCLRPGIDADKAGQQALGKACEMRVSKRLKLLMGKNKRNQNHSS